MAKNNEIIVLEDNNLPSILTEKGVEVAKRVEVEYFNEENERSLFNLVGSRIQEHMETPLVKSYLVMDEVELRKEVEPTPTINRLRISFWREYDRAQQLKVQMKTVNIYAGICPRETFENYLEDASYVAWMCKPPVDYINAMEEALSYGIDRMREILEVSLTQVESIKIGKDEFEDREMFNPKAAELIIKTVALLDTRVKGAVIQKVEQKVTSENRNVNATLTANITSQRHDGPPVDIDEEIRLMELELKKDLKKIQAPYTKTELNLAEKSGVNVKELTGIVDVESTVLNPETPKEVNELTETINSLDEEDFEFEL